MLPKFGASSIKSETLLSSAVTCSGRETSSERLNTDAWLSGKSVDTVFKLSITDAKCKQAPL